MTEKEYIQFKNEVSEELKDILDTCQSRFGTITVKRLIGTILTVECSYGNLSLETIFQKDPQTYKRIFSHYTDVSDEVFDMNASGVTEDCYRLFDFCLERYGKDLKSSDILCGISKLFPDILLSGALRNAKVKESEIKIGAKLEKQIEKAVNEHSNKLMFNGSARMFVKQIEFNKKMLYHRESIEQKIITILCKEYKPHVLLVGERGCGKKSIVNGVLSKIDCNEVPNRLFSYKYVELNNAMLLDGSLMRGNMGADTRMTDTLEEIKKKGKYITVVHELDDYSDLSEPSSMALFMSLANDSMPVIATTTPGGLKYLQQSSGFDGLFDIINCEETMIDETKDILNIHANNLSERFNVVIRDDVYDKTVDISKRYISSCVLPGSVINVLDMACATSIYGGKYCQELLDLTNKVDQAHKETIINARNGIDKYNAAKERELVLVEELSELKKQLNKSKEKTRVTIEDVKSAVSTISGIKLENLNLDDKANIYGIGERLKTRIIGQDEVIDKVSRIVKKAKVGLGNETRTRGNLLFIGKSGVGKTLIAKELARELFGDEKALVRFDMSEYGEKHSVSRLIGAPPGYVGYDNGGQLTSIVSQKKNCVILLDEVEKAHSDIFNIFLQVFDDGRLTDGKGRTVDFRNCFFILTSNIGAKNANERANEIGFSTDNDSVEKKTQSIIEKEVKNYFKPEFLNRLDAIMYFNPLTQEDIIKITSLELDKFIQRTKKAGYNVTISDSVAEKIYTLNKDDKKMGARPIVRKIETLIEDKLVDAILLNENTTEFMIDLVNDEVNVLPGKHSVSDGTSSPVLNDRFDESVSGCTVSD